MAEGQVEETVCLVLQWLIATKRVSVTNIVTDPASSDSRAVCRHLLDEWKQREGAGQATQGVGAKRALPPAERKNSSISHSLYSRGGAAADATAADAAASDGRKGDADADAEAVVVKKSRTTPAPGSPSPSTETEPEVCDFEGCSAPARFGLATSPGSTRCSRHKTDVMVEKAKRRKACDSCTTRKIKCDGVQPNCGPCSTRRAECRYSTRLKSGPKQKSYNQDNTPGRRGAPTEIAPAPQLFHTPVSSGLGPGTPGGRACFAQAAAAAAAAALSSAFPTATHASSAASPSFVPAPVGTAAAHGDEGPAAGASSAEPFIGSSGLEVSPRALAAHALTGFRYTKHASDAGGAVLGGAPGAVGGPGAAGAGNGLWPSIGSVENIAAAGEHVDQGGVASSVAEQASNVVDTASAALQLAAAAGAGDLSGLASLSYMAQVNPGLLAMLGLINPGYLASLSKLPPALHSQQQQLQAAAAMQAVAAQPLATAPQSTAFPSQPQSEQPGQLAPQNSLLDLPKAAFDYQQHQRQQPLQLLQQQAHFPQDPQLQGPDASRQAPVLAASAGTCSVQDVSTSHPLPQIFRHEPAAATGHATTLHSTSPPEQALPPKSPKPSPQGLHLLLISQELQEAVGSARSASGIGGGAMINVVDTGPSASGLMDVDQNRAVRTPGKSPRYRLPNFMKPVAKLRRSCDRCTVRKIRCDGNGVKCRRCLNDNAECHYSVKAKSGPKPQSSRPAPLSPMDMDPSGGSESVSTQEMSRESAGMSAGLSPGLSSAPRTNEIAWHPASPPLATEPPASPLPSSPPPEVQNQGANTVDLTLPESARDPGGAGAATSNATDGIAGLADLASVADAASLPPAMSEGVGDALGGMGDQNDRASQPVPHAEPAPPALNVNAAPAEMAMARSKEIVI